MDKFENFEVGVTHEPGHLRITAAGNYASEELFHFLDEVRAEAARAKASRVLIDARALQGEMTEAERFAGGQRIAELFGPKIKVALMMPERNITKLGELAAVNRGAQLVVTHSEEEALDFLKN